jgi:hypothetical protein
MEIDIFEIEYSVSPGGVDCWEAEVREYGETKNYSEYKTAGDALNHMLSLYGDKELNINVISLEAYAKLEEGAYA